MRADALSAFLASPMPACTCTHGSVRLGHLPGCLRGDALRQLLEGERHAQA